MTVLKYVLLGVYVIICLALIILTLVQNKEEAGASGTITGSSSNNFYNQNKGKTKEGRMKKWTIILAVLFAVMVVVTSTFYIV